MKAVPLTQRQASAFISTHHRHHKPARGDVFRLGVEVDGALVGVVQVGRPVARGLQDGKTAEVIRLCTVGCPNTCSFLLARAAKAAQALGYTRIYTYILDTETGASLKAAGWQMDGVTKGGSWDTPSRPREDNAPTCKKQRWVKRL